MTRTIAPVALLCSGCFLAPGMRMNEGALKDRAGKSSDPSRFEIKAITPQLLAAQERTRLEAQPPPRKATNS